MTSHNSMNDGSMHSVTECQGCRILSSSYSTPVCTHVQSFSKSFYNNVQLWMNYFDFCWSCISVFNQLDAQNLFHNKFYFMPLHVLSTCANHQEVKIALHSLWYHHTYRWPFRAWVERGHSQPVHETATCRCDDTRGCVMQFWPPDDELNHKITYYTLLFLQHWRHMQYHYYLKYHDGLLIILANNGNITVSE